MPDDKETVKKYLMNVLMCISFISKLKLSFGKRSISYNHSYDITAIFINRIKLSLWADNCPLQEVQVFCSIKLVVLVIYH